MKQGFYRAFEEQHRGPRALIVERLKAYFPFLEPLARRLPGAPAIDLGCGRGEWVELLRDLGFRSHGVDLDEDMLEGGRQAGLSIEKADALAYLRGLPDASQAVVSAFHLVEHLDFDDVQTIVSEAFRVLVEGGLLVLETPNPENIVIGTSNFYLDPTHRHPIPPDLLAFLPQFHGFARVKTLRLQEPAAVLGDDPLSLYDVLGSSSPDYAIVAQKAAAPETLQPFDAAFATEFGVSMVALAQRYEQQQAERAAGVQGELASLGQRLAEVGERARIAEDHANRLADDIRAIRERMAEADAQAKVLAELSKALELEQEHARAVDERATVLEHHEGALEQQVTALRQQVSDMALQADVAEAQGEKLRQEWLAFLDHRSQPWLARRRAQNPSRRSGPLLSRIVASLVEDHPKARLYLVGVLQRLRLHEPMRRAYWQLSGNRPQPGGVPTTLLPSREMPALSPRAQEIFTRFQHATQKKRKSS